MAVCNRFLNLRRAQEASTDEHTSAPALQVLAREAESLAPLPAEASVASPSTAEWQMKSCAGSTVLDQECAATSRRSLLPPAKVQEWGGNGGLVDGMGPWAPE